MEVKAFCSILGAILINLTLGTFYSIGNVMPYLASYMRANGNTGVKTEYGVWITATFLLGQSFFIVAGASIERTFNSRVACIVGCVIHCISTFLVIWAINQNFFWVVLTYGFGSGLGTGSAYMAAIIAAQKWFPTHKGVFTGIIVAGFGLGGLIFTSLQTLFLNPNNTKRLGSGYFPLDVANRVPDTFLYSGIIFTILQTLGCILSFPPPPPQQQGQGNKSVQNTLVTDDALPDLKVFFDIFKYKITYISCAMFMLVAPGVTFVNSLGKQYGLIFIPDDRFLSTVVAVCAVANAAGRFAWGYLLDKYSFTNCFMAEVILFASLITIFPFQFILASKVLYMITMLGLFFGFSGSFVIFPVFVEQVYGVKYNGMVYGSLYAFLAISSIISSLVIQTSLASGLEKFTTRFVPCIIIALLYVGSLLIYLFTLPTKRIENGIARRKEAEKAQTRDTLFQREDLYPFKNLLSAGQQQNNQRDVLTKENSLGSIVRYRDVASAEKVPKVQAFKKQDNN